MQRTIYVTPFDPVTKQATKPGTPSGFNSFDDVKSLMGAPLVQGKRTLTYLGIFYSDYNLVGLNCGT